MGYGSNPEAADWWRWIIGEGSKFTTFWRPHFYMMNNNEYMSSGSEAETHLCRTDDNFDVLAESTSFVRQRSQTTQMFQCISSKMLSQLSMLPARRHALNHVGA
ncbi:hypothetical protein K503DRAFT_768174 [Rhizopogon vinicolor AM-OR11-026]|uniref:Uncharacterized protein n=1 Tax=Rhizopogon vinicolor AM-OR11-026 TaxID=1314800 RepID=A0A1B7N7R0_9AGAM|nr:hypothetical protein K503DRAFT_768174 [Rhizopogon vinicolor AM-OR11-026]